MSKFGKQINTIKEFRQQAEQTKKHSYRTGKGQSVFMYAFGRDGFKPTKKLASILRKHTKNLIPLAVKNEMTKDIELMKIPGTTIHRRMYNMGVVDEYGNLLTTRNKALMKWTSTRNVSDMRDAYWDIEASIFTSERKMAQYQIIRPSTQGIDIELANRYVNVENTVLSNFDDEVAERVNKIMFKAVDKLNTNERRWFLAMLDTGQNGFSIRVIYDIAHESNKSSMQKSLELLDKFRIALRRTKQVAKNNKFKYSDLLENTVHEK